MVQRRVMYLGKINDAQREAWRQAIEVFDEGAQQPRQPALFPAGQAVPAAARPYAVQVRLEAMQLHRPQQ